MKILALFDEHDQETFDAVEQSGCGNPIEAGVNEGALKLIRYIEVDNSFDLSMVQSLSNAS